MPLYGQVVVGPPGSGKTTYCNGMQQFLRLVGRDCYVVNLDPANEYSSSPRYTPKGKEANEDELNEGNPETSNLPYETIYNVCEDMISLSSVMTQLDLGPNGGLLYCMEYIHKHINTLISTLELRISEIPLKSKSNRSSAKQPYILFDFPGQAELFTHCTCVKLLLESITKAMDFRLCAVQLIDAHFCIEAEKFISATLLSTSTMIRLELPMVNILSKVDLLQNNQMSGSVPFSLDFFTEMQDIGRLVDFLDVDTFENVGERNFEDMNENYFHYADDEEYQRVRNKNRNTPFHKKYRKLHQNICELVDDFGLLNFIPLDIQDATSVSRVIKRIDKCNGYVFSVAENNLLDGSENSAQDLFRCAVQSDEGEWNFEHLASIQEKFTNFHQETIPELSNKTKSSLNGAS